MTAFSAELWGAPGSPTSNVRLRIRKTNWGFAVTDMSDRIQNNSLEMALKITGLLLVPGGLALPIIRGTSASSGYDSQSMGVAIASALIGIALFLYANRGFGTEMRVDPQKREVRIGSINAKGAFRTSRNFQVSANQSFFLMRSGSPLRAKLCTRGRDGRQVIKLLNGTEAELIPLLERMSEALRPKELPQRRIRTHVTAAFIHATFD
jgi:hypothetical protein